MTIPLHKRLPILEIDQNCIISKRGEATAVFELFKPELFSLSIEELTAIHATWIRAIGMLPYGSILHLQDWYTRAVFRSHHDPDELRSYLSRNSDNHFNERPYRTHRCYCCITYRFGNRRMPTSALSSLLDKNLAPDGLLRPLQIMEFLNQCRQFIHILTEGGLIKARMMTDEDLAGSEDKRGLLEQYMLLQPEGQLGQLEDISLDKGVRIGNKHTLLYTLADAEKLPAQCSPVARYDPYSTERTPFPVGFGSPLGWQLDADHIYQQYLIIDNPSPKLKKLSILERRLKSLASNSPGNEITRLSVEQYLEEAAKGELKPAKAHFNVLAWTEDAQALPELLNKVVAAISRNGATPHLETVGGPQIWWSGLPGNAGDLPINETFDCFVEQAACFFIPESNGVSSNSPFGLRLGDRATGIPLHVDLSDEPMKKGLITNRNKFILGGSGSGKSFFINLLLRCYYELGAYIVLLDIGGSYKGLCELLGGYYFEYNEMEGMEFNPFMLAEGETLDTEKKESLKAILLVLWKKSDEAFGRSEYTALSNVLEGYHLYVISMGIFPCFDTFYEWLRDVFAPAFKDKGGREKDFDCANFLYVLRPYYKGGEFDRLLNARDQKNLLQEQFIVFELDHIKDHPILFPIVTIIIMELFISKMRKLHGVRKVILLEEAWKAIAKEGMSEFVKYLFKTVRKFFGEAIVVTQDIEDIVSSQVVKNTIINNADCKILLDQSKFMNRFDQIQDLLGLTEKDKTLALSLNKANDPTLNYKEVFISLGPGHSRVYRVEVSLEEYLVYTTEERQKVKVSAYAKRYGSFRHGITMLAEDIRSGAIRLLLIAAIVSAFLLLPNGHASAQVIDIVEEVVKDALEEADLKIQQLETQTLYLQNAEKALENSMTGGLLDDITGWVQQQESLYSEYYQELWTVKAAFSTYTRVTSLIEQQAQLVSYYQQSRSAVQRDPHFSSDELAHILNVYSGILTASIRNVGQLTIVIKDFITQMDDAGRLRIIDQTAGSIDRNYSDLRQYTQENMLLSLERAKDEADIQSIRALYAIQ